MTDARAPYVHDTMCIALPAPDGGQHLRWWYLQQPPPSVAFALQVRLAAALGPAADAAVRLAFRALDPEGEEDLEASAGAVGDALALQAFRRARTGLAISDGRGGEDLALAGARLRAVVAFVARHTGVGLDALALVGESEREKGGQDGAPSQGRRWGRVGLLHALLHESRCRYMGGGESPRAGSWATDPEDSPGKRLAAAADGAMVTAYVGALDAVLVSPEELALLSAWAVLHLYRPF